MKATSTVFAADWPRASTRAAAVPARPAATSASPAARSVERVQRADIATLRGLWASYLRPDSGLLLQTDPAAVKHVLPAREAVLRSGRGRPLGRLLDRLVRLVVGVRAAARDERRPDPLGDRLLGDHTLRNVTTRRQ